MALIKCLECNKEISDKAEACPHCGCPVNVKSKSINTGKPKKKVVVIGAAIVALCVVVIICANLILNANPVQKYLTLVNKNKTSKAIELYEEKIKDDEELLKKLSEEEKKNIDKIYSKYLNEEESYDNTQKQLSKFLKYDTSKKYANEVIEKTDALKASREAYDKAVILEKENNIAGAISNYGEVITEDSHYEDSIEKIRILSEDYKNQKVKSAEAHNKNKKYDKAIEDIDDAINTVGSTDELEKLKEKYEKNKSEMYVKVKVTSKTVTPKNSDNWIFSNYVNFVFKITNNSNKAIKGVEGTLIVYDLFDKEIIQMGCDFTGNTIASGKTITEDDLSYECNEFIDEDMKLFNTDYKDLKFKYEVESIVFSNGKKVKPE